MGTTYGKADLNPAEWRCLGVFYQGASEDIAHEYQGDEQELLEALTGDPFADWRDAMTSVYFHDNGGCASCGALFAHGAVFERSPAERIAIGHTCASDYFGLASVADLRTREAKKGAERRKLKGAWEAQLAEDPAFAAAVAWGTERVCSYCNEVTTSDADGNPLVDGNPVCSGRKRDDYDNHAPFERDNFINDVARRSRRYGGATEAQVAAVIKAHERGLKWEAERLAAKELDAPCPTGPQRIEGVVLATKWHENQFSYYGESILKMTVRSDEGYRVWGTVPSKLGDIEKGDRIAFNANVTPSDDDETFGFFKRPTKAERLEA